MTLSVVLPVYNVEAYLAQCLDSLLTQDFADFELIAVDDGSSDGSAAILEKYAAADKRLKIISQANAGLGSARNRGLDAARGKYIYFMDSDDLLQPNAFKRMIGELERNDLDQLVFSAKAFGDEGADESTLKRVEAYDKYYAISPSIAGAVVTGGELMARQLETGHLFVSVPLRVFKTLTLRESGCRFVEGVVREDESFANLVLLKSARVMAIVERFYLRRVRAGSLANGGAAARHVEGLLIAAVRLLESGVMESDDERLRYVADFILRNYRRAIAELTRAHAETVDEALELMVEHVEDKADVKRAKVWIGARGKFSLGELKWRIYRKLKRVVEEIFRP